MTFKDLRNRVESYLVSRREVSLPDDNILISLTYDAMKNIAMRYKVLTLLSQVRGSNVLRVLDDGWYIRKPIEPSIEYEDIELDIDDVLHDAVALYVAADLCSSVDNRKILNSKANKVVKDYNFKIYKTQKRKDL